MILLVLVTVLFFLGWCSGSRTEKPRCDCERCWYVSKPPVGAPIFCHSAIREIQFLKNLPPWVPLVIAGGAVLMAWFLRKK